MGEFLVRVLLHFCHGLRSLLQELVQIALLEQAIAVRWIAVHWDLTTASPFANRVLSNAEVLGRCRPGSVCLLNEPTYRPLPERRVAMF